jgi:phosphatidylserine/phosphatidylglycerophosphate/cardiolipin synthase-like enzyme
VFDKKYHHRIAVVAYLGQNAESFLPSPKGLKIICCPEPGATSPSSVRSLIRRGAEILFSDDLHAKVYWSEGGCVVTSANISHRALGRSTQKETGILIDSSNYDIDRLINEIKPYPISQKIWIALK